jgi:hypothetical protein
MNKLAPVDISQVYAPRLSADGSVISSAQGQIGQKIIISGVVIAQSSRAVDTLIGRTYSHFHVIKDIHGNVYHYRGSSFYPKSSKISVVATVKAFCRGDTPKSVVTVIKAPKVL